MQTATVESYSSWDAPRHLGATRGGRRVPVFTAEKIAIVKERYAWYRDRRLVKELAQFLDVGVRALYSLAYRLGLCQRSVSLA